jgi:hypothetical protein
VLSGRGLCVGLVSRSEGPYGLRRYLIVCDLETCTMRWPTPELGTCTTGKEKCVIRNDN